MPKKSVRGWTLLEMVIVCGLTAVLVAITGITWQRASANRKMDAAVSEIESAMTLARQTAQNQDGAYITFTAPTTSADGKWELAPGKSTDTIKKSVIQSMKIPQILNFATDPSTVTVLQFNSAGSIDSSITDLNSDGNYTVTISIGGDSRSTTLTVIGMTGAVVKTIQH
ncbi:type II secretion system protein [bacterium]|nr:type II secretion system protein [bacterium]